MSELSDLLVLVLLIFLPFLFSFFVILWFRKEDSLKKKVRSVLTLSPENGLIKQGLLWLCIVIPFLYFLELGWIAWKGCHLSLTVDGLETFLRISKFPLIALSVSIPLAGLVSRIHSTEQTAIQIKLAKHKNNLDSFYSHRKELFSYFSQIGEVDYEGGIKANYKVHPRLHKRFFKGAPDEGVPEINEAEFQFIADKLINTRDYIDRVVRDTNPPKTFDYYIYACSEIRTLGERLGLPEITTELPKSSVHVPYEERMPTTIGVTTDELVDAFCYAKNYFINLCNFASYTPSNLLYVELNIGEAGDKYKNIKQPLVVEWLHETIIKELIESQGGVKS